MASENGSLCGDKAMLLAIFLQWKYLHTAKIQFAWACIFIVTYLHAIYVLVECKTFAIFSLHINY